MQFTDTVERARQYGRAAMTTMDQLAIPANPNNYAVWYTYNSGAQPDIRREIDGMVSRREPITEDRILELFNRHFGSGLSTEDLQETSRRIEMAVGQLMGMLGEAGEQTADYGKTLASFSGKLATSQSADDVRVVISGILSETKKMAEHHKRLEAEIEQSAQEISELRKNMAMAQQEALTDALTGIANRKAFDERLERAMQDAVETGTELSLLLIDIDHFKKFNDTHGHQLGDEVLKLAAKIFTDCVKGRDMPARYGGEEFAIVLPQTMLVDAVTLANQIRTTIGSKKIVNRSTGKSLGTITISIGAARYRSGESTSEFVQRADQSLYAAKHGGRNRVISEVELKSRLAVAS